MIFDLLVLAIILISAIIAFFRGFIREVLTILGVGGGLVIAYILGPALQPLMHNLFGVEESETPGRLFDLIPYSLIADILAYGLIFVVFVGMLSVLSHYLSGSVRAIGLGALDRTLGVVFGILRAALILAILYLPLYILVDQQTRDEWGWLQNSRTRLYVEASSGWLAGFIPQSANDDAKEKAKNATDEISSKTRDKLKALNLLGTDQKNDNPQKGNSSDPATPGYEDGQRRQMENLIKENLND